MAASFCFFASIYAVGSKRFLAFEPVDFQLPRDPTDRTEPHGDGLLILLRIKIWSSNLFQSTTICGFGDFWAGNSTLTKISNISIPRLAFDEAVPLEYIGGRFLSLDGSLDELGVKFARFLEIRRLLSRDESRDLLMFWAADLPRVLVEYPPTPNVRLYVDNSVFNALTRISRLKNIILKYSS